MASQVHGMQILLLDTNTTRASIWLKNSVLRIMHKSLILRAGRHLEHLVFQWSKFECL